jgi:DNA-binding MarR family transcriptional regulator
VAKFNFVTEASIGRQVRLLVESGYLKQVPCKTDARKCYLTLTKKTETLVPKIMQRLNEELVMVYDDIATTEFITLDTLLAKLLSAGTTKTDDAVVCRS